MTGDSSRFTSDRRGRQSASWNTDEDWKAGVAENVEIVDGGLVSRVLNSQSEGMLAGDVSLTGTWDAGEKPTTTGNLLDGDSESGVTDGKMHDNNYQNGSVSAQILVQYDNPQEVTEFVYDVQISHSGSGWNSFGHSLNVSDGTDWGQIGSWSGSSGQNVSTQRSETLPFDTVQAVELAIRVNGGKGGSEWITAFVDFYNFQLVA